MDVKAGRWRSATKNRSRRLNCGHGDVCCVSVGLNKYKTNIGCGRILGYERIIGYWKNEKTEVVIAATESEEEGNCLSGRRRIAGIDDVRRWTEGGLSAARRIARDRLWQMRTNNSTHETL